MFYNSPITSTTCQMDSIKVKDEYYKTALIIFFFLIYFLIVYFF